MEVHLRRRGKCQHFLARQRSGNLPRLKTPRPIGWRGSELPSVVESPRPAHGIAPCRAAHALPVLSVVANFAGRPHRGLIVGIALPFEAIKVLAPDPFETSLRFALAVCGLDESLLGRRSGRAAPGGKISQLPSVSLKSLNLFFREDLSGTADDEGSRRHGSSRIARRWRIDGSLTMQLNDSPTDCEATARGQAASVSAVSSGSPGSAIRGDSRASRCRGWSGPTRVFPRATFGTWCQAAS